MASAPIDQSFQTLTAAMVIEWVNLRAVRGLKASTLGKQIVMLRSFLKFCHRSARTGQDFSGVVPNAAAWRLSSIPEPVRAGTIGALFESLDLCSPKGLRDRAILLLLTGPGLRTCEIAAMRLDDIGWPPLIRVDRFHDPACEQCSPGLESLAGHDEAELVETAEDGQVWAREARSGARGDGSVGHVEVFQVDGVGTSILGRPRPLCAQRRAE